MRVKVITCESGDWTIVEVDGKEVANGHSISNHDWVDILNEDLGIEAIEECISDEEMEMRS